MTSGGGPSDRPGSNTPATPEQRERDWAVKIIEQHQRRKKVNDIKGFVERATEGREEQQHQQQENEGGLVEAPSRPPRTEDKRQRMLLDIFDGRLGKLRLSLRSSAEAMLTIVGDFDAVATSEPGVVVVRGRRSDGDGDGEEVECLVDAKRCSALEFVRRTGQDGRDQFAITMKRLDDSSFLSVLLGGGAYPSEEAVARWLKLKAIYEGTALARVVLMPEGGIDSRKPSLDAGPLRPRAGLTKGSTHTNNADAPRQKREVRPVKPEVLIPRIE